MDKNIELENQNKFFMVLKSVHNLPGVHINRKQFLYRELSKHFSPDVVKVAIEMNPAYAGISIDQIEMIAKNCINHETNRVTCVSTLTGIPGGPAMFGTVPADAAQYFAHLVRVLQKIIYLYGWQELYNSDGEFDDETSDKITLFVGVMFGVNAANAVITKIAHSTANKINKKVAGTALTKGVVYPVVKKVARILGYKMTKEMFAKSASKIIPILGGMISGGVTYITFKPMANNLKNHLSNQPLADVEYYKNLKKDVIDVEFSDLTDL